MNNKPLLRLRNRPYPTPNLNTQLIFSLIVYLDQYELYYLLSNYSTVDTSYDWSIHNSQIILLFGISLFFTSLEYFTYVQHFYLLFKCLSIFLAFLWYKNRIQNEKEISLKKYLSNKRHFSFLIVFGFKIRLL